MTKNDKENKRGMYRTAADVLRIAIKAIEDKQVEAFILEWGKTPEQAIKSVANALDNMADKI